MTEQTEREERRASRAAAIGGAAGLLLVGIVVAVLGSYVALLPIIIGLVLMVMLFNGSFSG